MTEKYNESNWREARDANGRVYYYDTVTKQSSWEKPKDLYSQEDKLLENSQWGKYYSEEAKRYYFYNSETKQTTWAFPLKVEDKEKESRAANKSNYKDRPKNDEEIEDKDIIDNSLNVDKGNNNSINLHGIFHTSSSKTDTDKLIGETKAKTQYFELLDENDVDVSWSFQKVMESFIEDSRYWIISDPLLKQSYFEEFILKKSKAELLKYNNSKHKLQQDFKQLIQTYSANIKYYTRWSTFKKSISEEPIYTHSLLSSREKKEIFMEFVNKLKLEHLESEKQIHEQATLEFEDYFDTSLKHELKYDSNWADMLKIIREDPRVAENKNFEKLTELDMLHVYKRYYAQVFESLKDSIKNLTGTIYTEDRIARDEFRKLLNDMKDDGAIGITCEFEDIYLFIKDEPAFKNLLGREGSNALTLFWDLIENENNKLLALKKLIYETLKSDGLTILMESLQFVIDFCKSKKELFLADMNFIIENKEQIYDLLVRQTLNDLTIEKKLINSTLDAMKLNLQKSIQLLLTKDYIKGNTAKEKLNFANTIKWKDFKEVISTQALLEELKNFTKDNYKVLYDEEYEKFLKFDNFKLLRDSHQIKSIFFTNTQKECQKEIFDDAELKKLFFKLLIQVKEEYIQAEKFSHSNNDFMDY